MPKPDGGHPLIRRGGELRKAPHMPDSRAWPPKTMRAAIVMALDVLDNMASEDDVTYARATLVYALALLDASSRVVGVFQDEEPFRLVLDPLPGEVATPLLTKTA